MTPTEKYQLLYWTADSIDPVEGTKWAKFKKAIARAELISSRDSVVKVLIVSLTKPIKILRRYQTT